jgi:hypothetical protein
LDLSQPDWVESAVSVDVGWADELAVSGRWLYVGSVFVGVLILDVSQPQAVAETGVIVDTGGQVESLAAEGTVLLVGSRTGTDRLVVLEASEDRPALRSVAEFPVEGELQQVALSGDRGYVLSTNERDRSSRIINVDLSAPTSPRMLDTVTLDGIYKAMTPFGAEGAVALVGMSSTDLGEVRLVDTVGHTDLARALLPAASARDGFEVQAVSSTLVVRNDSAGVMSFGVAAVSPVRALLPAIHR